MRKRNGFTLMEMLIIAALIGILAMIVIPQFKNTVIRAKEAALKKSLFNMREQINNFFADKKRYPTSLEELVSFRYLREIPMDPFLKKREWELINPEPIEGEDFDLETAQAVIDVRSLNPGTALDGSKLQEW